jgi:hypothetical protein
LTFRIEDYDLSNCNEFEEVFQLALEFKELKTDLIHFLSKLNINLSRDFVKFELNDKNQLKHLTKELVELILFFTQE